MIRFEISDEQEDIIEKWLYNAVRTRMTEQDKLGVVDPVRLECWKEGYPYEGAIGGGLEYLFIPTSLGTIFKVRYHDWVLDLTDYGSW